MFEYQWGQGMKDKKYLPIKNDFFYFFFNFYLFIVLHKGSNTLKHNNTWHLHMNPSNITSWKNGVE